MNNSKVDTSLKLPVLFKHVADCCGCSACANACPKNAITMVEDEEGFEFPKINDSLCVHCGICTRSCGFQKGKFSDRSGKVYAATGIDVDIQKSSSGGLFSQIAFDSLSEGAIICACSLAFNECGDSSVNHVLADSQDEVFAMLGSKYVQSNLSGTMSKVRELLSEGKKVVFCGTPCQVAGLKSFLGLDYDNLLTLDLVCHGVPSRKLFASYINFLKRNSNGIPKDFTFRSKRNGWENYTLILRLRDNHRKGLSSETEICIPAFSSSYYDLFLNRESLRESCYSCLFAGSVRPGDITIGDYWGIEVMHPETLTQNGGPFDLAKGVSCMLINTKRGEEWLSEHSDSFVLYESSFDRVAKGNEQLKKPSVRGKKRNQVYTRLNRGGYASVERMCLVKLSVISAKKRIARFLPKSLKNGVKKIIRYSG